MKGTKLNSNIARILSVMKLFFCLLVFAFTACTNTDTEELINLSALTQPSYREVFSSTKIVKLETKPESMLAGINQVEYFDGHYYVFDGKQQAIFCFTDAGYFVYKLQEQGRGPGEYVYVQSFTLDKFNKQLILLSPSVGEITIFGLDGKFLSKKKLHFDEPIGINKIHMLDSNTLIMSSISRYQVLLYDLTAEKIKDSFFEIPVRTGALMPAVNTYSYADSVFVLPYLTSDVFSITTSGPALHFKMDFGKDNNSKDQLSSVNNVLFNETSLEPLGWHHLVGKGRFLNHHILKVFESSRFRLAMVIHDDAIKHVVTDKDSNNTFVFKEFAEGFVIHLFSTIYDNNFLISFDLKYNSIEKAEEMHGALAPYFMADFFDINSLSPESRDALNSHDLLTDNPFLVVHKFRE